VQFFYDKKNKIKKVKKYLQSEAGYAIMIKLSPEGKERARKKVKNILKKVLTKLFGCANI